MKQRHSGSQAPAAGTAATAAAAAYRQRLTRGEDVIDPETWAGSVPAATGIAPRAQPGIPWWVRDASLPPKKWCAAHGDEKDCGARGRVHAAVPQLIGSKP